MKITLEVVSDRLTGMAGDELQKLEVRTYPASTFSQTDADAYAEFGLSSAEVAAVLNGQGPAPRWSNPST